MADALAVHPSSSFFSSASPLGLLDHESGLYTPRNNESVDPPTANSHDFDDSPPDTTNNEPSSRNDKPRPHLCNTCGRSFARLEHLKRHERSHTKEKPFECPECTRCFARRDLLLRHQQKLHMTTTPASKPRQVRRDSIVGAATSTAKIRKNSVASTAPPGRPRANTISHIDGNAVGKLVASSTSNNGESTPAVEDVYNLARVHTADEHFFPQYARNASHHGQGPPGRVNTQGLGLSTNGAMRTAPIESSLNAGFDFDQLFGPGSTINPAQLQMGDAHPPSAAYNSGQYQGLTNARSVVEEDENFDWMRGFNHQMSFNHGVNGHHVQHPDYHVPGSTSSGISNASELPILNDRMHVPSNAWHPSIAPQQMSAPAQYYNENSNSFFPDFSVLQEPPSKTFGSHLHHVDNNFMSSPNMLGFNHHGGVVGAASRPFSGMAFSSDRNSVSSSSMHGRSARNSNATTVLTDSITEITRQTLLVSLSQPSVFGLGHRKYSTAPMSSPLSPRDAGRSSVSGGSLPSTSDLQRYVSAYIHYFHPHFPFLHIPTLSFDTPAFTTTLRQASPSSNAGIGGIMGGGGCLILATAAIGALYEFDRSASKDLFEASKRMIQLYLEERRKVDASASINPKSPAESPAQTTPLWLVQAMLLNVIYGHNCGDKISGDIASTHCAALISLARSAELVRPLRETSNKDLEKAGDRDVKMETGIEHSDNWNAESPKANTFTAQWQRWAASEERKRTLYAIYHLSSLLVSAYNHAPALMNSEIHLDLPCDEELWCAESASIWSSKGGSQAAEQQALSFGTALSTLLGASQVQREQATPHGQTFGSGVPRAELPQSDLNPSTFGCLILIDALHNYIWETRQRHNGRQWTTQETESMHAHIEPALRAWQAAWASNPLHSLERPNPFGLGPLSADSIPLLDLAYVRLFVHLGASKEAFWKREFDVMAEELARGSEIIQHAEHSEFPTETTNTANASRVGSPGSSARLNGYDNSNAPQNLYPSEYNRQTSKRERHMRKAAFYAADSLSMSDKLNVTFADFTSRELPVQSAMCAFDCAQVLAEWLATVQERVGRYLGVLGKAEVDYQQVPAIMLLEDEDCKLLEKVADILNKAESKMTYEISGMGTTAAMAALNTLPSMSGSGYGSKILMITAYLLERAAVWPVTGIMAKALHTQAAHMNKRAVASLALA